MEIIHHFHKAITRSHLKTTYVCFFLSPILSLLPILVLCQCQVSLATGACHFDDYAPKITNKSNYCLWLLIATISIIPMFCDIILDLPTHFYSKEMHDFGVYRVLLLICLIVPNLSIYFILIHPEIFDNEGMLIRSFIFSLTYLQVGCLFIITQVSLYCSKWKSNDEEYQNLKTHLGNCIMYFLIIWVISHMFFTVKLLYFQKHETLIIFFNIIIGANCLIFSYCIISITYNLSKHFITTKLNFVSNHKISDVVQCIALLIYAFSYMLFLYSVDVYMICLYLQITSTLLLTVIPSQVNLLRAEAKGDKLKAKLNTIRYVSHEMRTPLNISILGSKLAYVKLAQLLNSFQVGNVYLSSIKHKIESLANTVSKITSFCNKAVTTLDDVLTFDKLDEHKLVLEHQIICPLELLRGVIALFEENAKSRNIDLRLVCLPENDVSWLSAIDFSCDIAKISQILHYLLSNAIKYTPSHGDVSIYLEKCNVDNSALKSMVRICVKDTGCGLLDEDQCHIFTQFVESAAESTQDDINSPGLGLWISKKIIELHDGNISVFSLGLGHGTTFTIDLPVLDKFHSISNNNNTVIWSASDHEFASVYSPLPLIDVSSNQSIENVSPQLTYASIQDTANEEDGILYTHSSDIFLTRIYRICSNYLSRTKQWIFRKYMRMTPLLKGEYFICGGMLYYTICTIVLCVYKIFGKFKSVDTYHESKSNETFPEWSIASLLLFIPLLLNNIFELIRIPSSWIYSTILTIGLIVPSVLNYFVWHISSLEGQTLRYEILEQLQMLQYMLVNTCLLSLTFLGPVETYKDAYFNLKQWISNMVPLYVIVILVSKTIFLLGNFISYSISMSSNTICFFLSYYISFILDYVSQAIALFCCIRLIVYHLQNNKMTKLESHNQLSDLLHCIVTSINLLALSIVWITLGLIGDFFILKYASILLVIILFVVIPNRVNLFHVNVNKLKLKIRAHLMTHLSQQMENPINEAISSATEALRLIEGFTSDLSLNANITTVIHDVAELMNEIFDSCKVSEMTLADMFILDQIEDQKLTIDMEMTDPWILIRSVASPFSIVARSSNINFTISNTYSNGWPSDICLHCDKFKISQVIRNLISNALKFTPAGGEVSIMLELVEDSENNEQRPDFAGTIRITVRDSGAGISIENQKKMFGQYVQFNAAQLQNGKGSGLGLWISKNIVQLHEGDVSVYSAGEGSGSMFTLTLPAFKNESNTDINYEADADSRLTLQSDLELENHVNEEIVLSSIPDRHSLMCRENGDTFSIISAASSKQSIENDIFCSNRFTICRDKLDSPSPSLSTKSFPRSQSVPLFARTTLSNKSTISFPTNVLRKAGSKSKLSTKASTKHFDNDLERNENGNDLDFSNQHHILVVDDSSATRKMLIRLLIPLGFKVTEAKDGWDCLKKCHCPFDPSSTSTYATSSSIVCGMNYDAILIDDSMPNMHGPEAVTILRRHGYNGFILGLTGSVDNDTKVKFKSSGADEVLFKPLDMNKLKELLLKHHVLF